MRLRADARPDNEVVVAVAGHVPAMVDLRRVTVTSQSSDKVDLGMKKWGMWQGSRALSNRCSDQCAVPRWERRRRARTRASKKGTVERILSLDPLG
jgi:hypothetical protein